jgi:hypothetical protein
MDLETTASQYGVVGILALLLGYFAWAQWQRLEKKNRDLEIKVDKLQSEMMDLITEERDRMTQLVAENTKAIHELTRVILEYVVKG